MRARPSSAAARLLGGLVGTGLAAVVLIGARPTPDFPRLPATIRLEVPVTGEIEATPAAPRPVLASRSLTPDAKPRVGTFRIRNQTGWVLRVGFRAHGSAEGLEGLVRIRLGAGGRPFADTTLQGLRHGSERGVLVPSGGSRRISIRAWIPGDVGDGYEGRRADVSLVPVVRAAG